MAVRRTFLQGLRALLPFGAKQTRNIPYQGAGSSRLNMDWITGPISADQETRSSLRKLRSRARDLKRNSAVARSFVSLSMANVIGGRGFKFKAKIRNNSDQLADVINKKIEKAWAEQMQPENCTVTGQIDGIAAMHLAFETERTDGECFIRLVYGYDNKYQFALQFIDADQLDENYYEPRNPATGNEVRMSIELDKWGRPVAYWVLSRHPNDTQGETNIVRERVPAEEMIHLFRAHRPGQTRGVSPFAPIMLDMRMLDGYIEAELVAARLSSSKCGFLTSSPDAFTETPDPSKSAAPLTMDANPGVITQLPAGVSFTHWSPDHPAQAFPNFVKTILRRIASGLNVPYVALANDLEGVNYSSIRHGELSARDQWRIQQQWFESMFLMRVYKSWLKMAVLSGNLTLDGRQLEKYHNVDFTPRGWSWVDPLKDAEAAILMINNHLDTRTDLAAEEGDDFEDKLRRISEEQALAKSLGVDLEPPNAKVLPQETGTGAEPANPVAGSQAKTYASDEPPAGKTN